MCKGLFIDLGCSGNVATLSRVMIMRIDATKNIMIQAICDLDLGFRIFGRHLHIARAFAQQTRDVD